MAEKPQRIQRTTEEIDGILSAIELLFAARDAIMSKASANFFYMCFGRWKRDSRRLERVQAYLLDQLDMGGWNCFRMPN